MIRSISPQRPDDVVVEAEAVTPMAVSAAAEQARRVGSAWQADALARSRALTTAADALAVRADEFGELIVREVGKPRTEAVGEVQRAIAILRYYAQQPLAATGEVLPGAAPGTTVFTTSRARGVAGLITPWNFPLAIPMWKAAPALAYGNAVLLKPSSAALGVALRLADVLSDALPEDVFTVLPGERETAEALVDSSDVVSFTGSTAVGRSVVARAGARAIACQAEMGGTNVSVIGADADLKTAAGHIAGAAYAFAGQKCTATSHVLVVGDASEASEALIAAASSIPVGDPAAPETVSGPLIDADAAHRCADAVTEAVEAGARMLAEVGERDGDAWQPLRLLTDVPAGTRLADEEVFGPVMTVRSVGSVDEAVSVVNAQRYGLVSAIYTADLDEALRFGAAVRTGMVKVNAPTTGVDYWAPFGGEKESSFGPREQGTAARQLYTVSQTLSVSAAR